MCNKGLSQLVTQTSYDILQHTYGMLVHITCSVPCSCVFHILQHMSHIHRRTNYRSVLYALHPLTQPVMKYNIYWHILYSVEYISLTSLLLLPSDKKWHRTHMIQRIYCRHLQYLQTNAIKSNRLLIGLCTTHNDNFTNLNVNFYKLVYMLKRGDKRPRMQRDDR